MKVALGSGTLYCPIQGITLIHSSIRNIVRPGQLRHIKFPITPLAMESTTFRLVMQCHALSMLIKSLVKRESIAAQTDQSTRNRSTCTRVIMRVSCHNTCLFEGDLYYSTTGLCNSIRLPAATDRWKAFAMKLSKKSFYKFVQTFRNSSNFRFATEKWGSH
jgi:hypothetical protein